MSYGLLWGMRCRETPGAVVEFLKGGTRLWQQTQKSESRSKAMTTP